MLIFTTRRKGRMSIKNSRRLLRGTTELLLSPAQTRWLSLQDCVNRILEQYEALKSYFVLAANDDPSLRISLQPECKA